MAEIKEGALQPQRAPNKTDSTVATPKVENRDHFAALKAQYVKESPREVTERYLNYLGIAPDDVIEVQIKDFDPQKLEAPKGGFLTWKKGKQTGFSSLITRGPAAAATAIHQADQADAEGVYIIPNKLHPDLRHRVKNDEWNPIEKGKGTSDNDIVARRTLYIDCDPQRPRGISGTAEEMRLSAEVAKAVFNYLCEHLPPTSIAYGMSGNGSQLYVRLDDIPTSELTPNKVTSLLDALQDRFGTDRVDIDGSVKDARRLGPAFGTMKRKGVNSDERPHRRTMFICYPDPAKVTLDQLDAVTAALQGSESQNQGPASNNSERTNNSRKQSKKSKGPLTQVNEQTNVLDVYAKLGGDPAETACPSCQATDVKHYEETNILKCYHNSCGETSWTPARLVGMMAFDTDPKEVKGPVVSQIIDWFREHFEDLTLDAPSTPSTGREHLPRVIVGPDESRVIQETVASLKGEDIYQRGNLLCRTLDDFEGRSTIQEMTSSHVRTLITESCVLTEFSERKKTYVETHPTKWLVDGVRECGTWEGIPQLTAVYDHPVMLPTGEILDSSGLHPESGIFRPEGLPLDIPDHPTLAQAQAAYARLIDVVRDFPFVDDTARATWVGTLLQELARPAIQGPVPATLIDANTRGAGKSLLLTIKDLIVRGRTPDFTVMVPSQEELRKKLTSMIIAGVPSVHFDNIGTPFGNEVMDMLLTGDRWEDRLLGGNTRCNLPIQLIVYATGNNCSVVGDTTRRVVLIRLFTAEARPETRQGFVNPDIHSYVLEHRQELLSAAFTILRAFHQAGRPNPTGVYLGSYRAWASLVPAALVWLGQPNPIDTQKLIARNEDSDEVRLENLMSAWLLIWGGAPVKLSDIVSTVTSYTLNDEQQELKDAIDALWSTPMRGQLTSHRLARKLRQYLGRTVGDYRIIKVEDPGRRGSHWQIERVDGMEIETIITNPTTTNIVTDDDDDDWMERIRQATNGDDEDDDDAIATEMMNV